ncbi:hypothetical protein [Xylanimonas protaetiae]|uniref:Non-reducing end beta-L-arabinofuranosidase-like GH127 C-terminal domain-containing protein n=1 Tax=Xylanimonas protaetiae TaxID=2509457 RepID=A0A4P6F618_9MICO|nr:hypothetical protein [Xylanimonas protaetiae]QAY70845.1 hypothetical protein ET471_13105 [Xylanimonas protaetiae]
MSSPVPVQRALPASPIAATRHRPLPVPAVRLVGGPLGSWQERNGTATIPHCVDQLEASGVLDDFRRLVGESAAAHRGFVHTWIQGVAQQRARPGRRPRARGRRLRPAPLTPGATYVLEVDRTPRRTTAHHRVDALRGVAAVERGPIVYCVEHAGLAPGIDVDGIALVPDALITAGEGGTLTVRCRVTRAADHLSGTDAGPELGAEHTVTAIPFSPWGNGEPGPMRVWLPVAPC